MEGDRVVCYYSTKEQPMSYAGIHQYAQLVGYYNSYINIRVVVKKNPLLCRIGVKSLIVFFYKHTHTHTHTHIYIYNINKLLLN